MNVWRWSLAVAAAGHGVSDPTWSDTIPVQKRVAARPLLSRCSVSTQATPIRMGKRNVAGKYAMLFTAALMLGGCASIIKGSGQSIAISTPPTAGATCTLTNGLGTWSVTSPGVVKVDKSKQDMQVHCSKPGWQDPTGTIPSNFEGWTVGNLILGGIIGVGVDAATGAINEYQHSFQVPMVQLTSMPEPIQPQPGVPRQ